VRKKKRKESSWEWYAVKLLYECIITGEPDPETIDYNYNNTHKTYEESIMLVRAQPFENAYSIAEKKSKDAEIEYVNPYEERVKWKFIEALDCFIVGEDLESGTEVYSRYLRIPNGLWNTIYLSQAIEHLKTTETIKRNYFPFVSFGWEHVNFKDDIFI
jgi:hypothetical protein